MKEKKLYGSKLLKTIILSIFISTVVLVMLILHAFTEVEYGLEDHMYQRPASIPNNIKIIAIDENTLDELGPYSNWNRQLFAELINILNEDSEYAPQIIGIDVVFTGTDDSDGDRALTEAVKNAGNVVLASQIEFSHKAVNNNDTYVLEEVCTEYGAYSALNDVSEHGFTNAIIDKDGYVRSAYGVIANNGNIYKNFSYIISELAYNNNPEDYPKADLNKGRKFRLAYTGNPGDFESISMTAVLSKKVPASYFKDSIVLVGAYEEGLLDSYNVPIMRGKKMYGVEFHANTIWAILTGKQSYEATLLVSILITLIILLSYSVLAYNTRLRTSFILLLIYLAGYILMADLVYRLLSYRLTLLYIPIGCILAFLISLIMKYVEMQKQKAKEMEETLFSMADAMAEAIDGRTPYNASHTKNVANRSVEILDYINDLYKAGKTKMHFSKSDRKQLYLAAMLHDVGKMDVPIEVMDKPTKLGEHEKEIIDRLSYIKVLLERDMLLGKLTKDYVDKEYSIIDAFLGKLGLYNCGKPLKPEDFAEADILLDKKYELEDGSILPYLTQEESDSIHIKAGTLSDTERATIQSHVTYTDKILSHVVFGSEFDKVRAMASNHHEVLNGKGYPKGLEAKDLDTLTRILTIMDIYDALVADDRPYKKAKPIPVAFEILDEEAAAGKIDKELLEIAKELYLKPVLEDKTN